VRFSAATRQCQFSSPAIPFALALIFVPAGISRAAVDLAGQFEREVRPVLAEHCFQCHGQEKQKGGLRMDRRPALLSGGDSGEPAILPGKSAESPLAARIVFSAPDEIKDNAGRDHQHTGFSTLLARGGVRGGIAYGETDELGMNATVNPVHMHDLHATIPHLLGLDHERLTYRYAGRDFRLTDVFGHVVHDIMA
jgi:mono/diheme cytochrome c family protein